MTQSVAPHDVRAISLLDRALRTDPPLGVTSQGTNMKRHYQWALGAAVGLLVVFSGTAAAQDASLSLVPGNAPIVVQVNGFEKARGRLGTFLANALPDLAPKLVQKLDENIKELAAGRDLKVIKKDARLFLVVPDLGDIGESPGVAILVPVTSYADFKKDFLKADERKSLKKDDDGFDVCTFEGKDEPIFLVDRKDYLVATNSKDVAKKYTKSDGAGLGKTLSKDTAKAFLDQDAAVYINLQAINKQFGDKIKQFKLILGPLLQMGGMVDKKQAELMMEMFDGFVALLEDGTAAVIGAEFRPEGFNFKFTAQFKPQSDTSAFLKKFKPAALAEINSLPSGRQLYAATNFNPFLSKTLSKLLREATADDDNEEAKAAIGEAIKELGELGRSVDVSSANLPGNSLEVTEYKDGAKALAAQVKVFKALTKSGSFGNLPLKSKPEIKENAETVGDYKMNFVKFEFDFDKAVEKLPENVREATKASMMKFAGETTKIWFGQSGGKLIQVSAKDWKEAKALIEGYLDGKNLVSKDEMFAATRKQLPEESTFVVIGDTTRLIEAFYEMMKEQLGAVPGLPIPMLPELKAPKGKPAYFGVAIVMKAEFFEFDLFVPTTAVAQVRKMFSPLINMDN